MGRYYNGDIEGKFWFGVQPSDDGEFFGAVASEPSYIDYYVDDIEKVEEGLKKCKDYLGVNENRLNDFFKERNGYNEEMLAKHWQDVYGIALKTSSVQEMLGWYARLQLGLKIFECVNKNQSCSFTAEL